MQTESSARGDRFIERVRARLDRQAAQYTITRFDSRKTDILRLTGAADEDAVHIELHYRVDGVEARISFEANDGDGWAGFYEYGEDAEELLEIIEGQAKSYS